jgi:HEAT repeat protein
MRRRRAALAGHEGDAPAARRLLADPDPGVRATALGALARLGVVTDAEVAAAAADPDPTVRSRAAEVVASGAAGVQLLGLLADPDPAVAEVAAWASGERPAVEPEAVERLADLTISHEDPLVREAAVAALGAIGDRRGLGAVLAATKDRATVRRRAVLALAPFDGPEVEQALRRALDDRDWQVRQAAEDLLGDNGPPVSC